MEEATDVETVHIVQDGVVDPQLGAIMARGRDYKLPADHAKVRYQRGHARPAAEVYLERLRAMGVVGVVITNDAEPSVRLAAKRAGVACRSGK